MEGQRRSRSFADNDGPQALMEAVAVGGFESPSVKDVCPEMDYNLLTQEPSNFGSSHASPHLDDSFDV